MSRLLIFDSGIGGLSVARAVRDALPEAAIDYVADDAAFPYGEFTDAALVARVMAVLGEAISALEPGLVVIACNTASTLVLPHLRARFDIPFVGTVPAIKPAAEQTRTGLVSVLATPGTMGRDYTRDLIRSFAGACQVRLVGSALLAPMAEAEMAGEPAADEDIRGQIAPAFVEVDGRRTDTVVLGCTHYPFLLGRFGQLAPWPVSWIDPARAIARRVVELLGADAAAAISTGPSRAFLTSGRRLSVAGPLMQSLRLEAADGWFSGTPAPRTV